MMPRVSERTKRALMGIVSAVAIATLGVGFLHTKQGRPFLMKLARAGGCPMGTPAQTADARAQSIAHDVAGVTTRAPARPALGFALDSATLSDVQAWAKSHHVDCDEKDEGTELVCRNVTATALPEARAQSESFLEVSFGFHQNGHLQQVTTLANRLTADEGSERFSRTAHALTSQLGAPTVGSPETSSAHLASRPYATATMSYRYADYLATVTVMNGKTGVLVREQYLSANRG